MKKYQIYLYVDEIKCYEHEDENCRILNCFNCHKCAVIRIIDEYGKEIINTYDTYNFDRNTISETHLLLETNDKIDENNFVEYFFDEKSDFRLTDLETNRIMVDFYFDYELLKDLVDEYGYENINIYNKSYDEKELKKYIRKLKLYRNSYLALYTAFNFILPLSLFQLFNGKKLFALIALLISLKGCNDTWEYFEQNYIDLKVHKRLLKKIDNK